MLGLARRKRYADAMTHRTETALDESAPPEALGGQARAVDRPLIQSIRRGASGRCPRCGDAPLYRAYLKPHDSCPNCGLALHEHRADDLPPYLTILIAGHLIVPAMLFLERTAPPPLWAGFLIWSTAAIGLCLALLPPVKGAVIGIQWACRMHGFDDAATDAQDAADQSGDPAESRS